MSNVCTWPSCKCTAKGQCEGLGCRILVPTFTAADLERAMKEGMRIATTVPTEKVSEAFAAALAAFDKTDP